VFISGWNELSIYQLFRGLKNMAMKKTAKKTPAKKAASKKPAKAVKTVAKATKPKTAKTAALSVKTPFTKSQMVNYLAEKSELKRKDVVVVLDGIMEIMTAHLSKKGPGELNFAGMMKCRVIHKPATKARKGINPFTGLETTFAAKPARNVLKIRPLRKLKLVTE
jgi:nucleoid DNA-binding protein